MLRIGTWNLEHARSARHDAVRLNVLERANADVWVLTETNDRVSLRGYAACHSAPRPSSTPGGRWVSIWTRLPILEVLQVQDCSRAAAARIASPVGELLAYGTVLPWHADVGEPPIEPKPAAWSEQYRTIPLQAADWLRLHTAHPRALLTVAGDLNMSLGGPRYYGTTNGRSLLTQAMQAVELFCATSFERVPAGMLQHPAIDHILLPSVLSGRASVATAWEGTVSDLRLSDHSGLVVELDLSA